MRNEIRANLLNGIFCTGKLNYTKIQNNSFIGFNSGSGIRAEHFCYLTIFKNCISNNCKYIIYR